MVWLRRHESDATGDPEVTRYIPLGPTSWSEARSYVERFAPFDTAGSYRLEDAAHMAPLEAFVVEVVGEHDSGVLGLPLPLLRRLLADPRLAA